MEESTVIEGILTHTDNTPAQSKSPKSERKMTRYVEFLRTRPDLKRRIKEVLLKMAHKKLPLLHITTTEVSDEAGEPLTTGFLDSIRQDGVRVNTNVSAFVRRGEQVVLADPICFYDYPERLVQDMETKLRRYIHHGVRTNKDGLREAVENSGTPIMVVISADGAELKRGTDYDDHYILSNPLSPDAIIGTIQLDQDNPNTPGNLEGVLTDFLDIVDQNSNLTYSDNPSGQSLE